MNVAVLIRVYDRVEDLKYNLGILIDTWLRNNYYVIVVSNGYDKGYVIDDKSQELIDKLVVLDTNAGHRKGNSQLLLEGIKHIPDDCEYTIILEADTWIYNDRLIKTYIDEMEDMPDVVWASANWYDKFHSLATDFAIIKTKYILDNPDVFDFDLYPECYIANHIRKSGSRFIYINENMPVHVPSYVIKYPYVNNSKDRRFYVFPYSRMVTHHVEYLKKGIEEKKRYFNIVSGRDYFADQKLTLKRWELFKMKFWIGLTHLFIKRSWFSKKVFMKI